MKEQIHRANSATCFLIKVLRDCQATTDNPCEEEWFLDEIKHLVETKRRLERMEQQLN